jgi:hypothetical protein
MLDALYGSAKLLIKKPFALLPLFIASIIATLSSVLFSLTFLDMVLEIVSYGTITHKDSISAIMFFTRMQAGNIATILGVLIATLWLIIFFGIYYCRYVKTTFHKGSVKNALQFAFKSLPNSIAFLIALLIFSFVCMLFGWAFILMPVPWLWLYIVLLTIYLLLVFVIMLKLFLFALPALAYENINAKKALQASWSFVEKHFWQAILLAIILVFFALAIGALQASALLNVNDTLVVVIVMSIFNAIILGFSLGTLTLYYSKHTS